MSEANPPAGSGWTGDHPTLSWLLLPIALAGVGVASYLTRIHHHLVTGFAEADCSIGGLDCAPVLISEWSELPGTDVSISTPGIVVYLLVAALVFWGRQNPTSRFPVAAAWAAGALSLAFSFVLGGISAFVIGAFCPYCMALYVVNAGLFGVAWAASRRAPGVLVKDLLGDSGLLTKVAVAGVVLFGVAFAAEVAYHGYLEALVIARVVGTTSGTDTGRDTIATRVAPTQESDITSSDQNGRHVPLAGPDGLACTAGDKDGDRWCVPLQPDDAWKGNPDASVIVVEYADFQCGYCKRMTNVMHELEQAYHGDVLFIFKHFPMSPRCNPGVTNDRHRQACGASVAAVCAQEQGRFWDFHDLAFKNQHKLGNQDLLYYAEELDLDMGAFRSCISSNRSEAVIRTDAEGGAAMEVNGTPRIFINGQVFRGVVPAQALARAIEMELGRSAAEANAASRELSSIDAQLEGVATADAPEMTEIRYDDLHFMMDTFEASWSDGPGSAAVSAVGQVPAIGASWFQAQAACEAAGKRMCSEQEWIAACQGAAPVDDDADGEYADDYIEGWSYPYSDYYQRSACWDTGDLRENRPHYTGSSESCRSRDDVFDLVGNLQEWVGTSAEDGVLLGGAYYNAEKSRCYRRNNTFGPGLRNATTGFRCCADPS